MRKWLSKRFHSLAEWLSPRPKHIILTILDEIIMNQYSWDKRVLGILTDFNTYNEIMNAMDHRNIFVPMGANYGDHLEYNGILIYPDRASGFLMVLALDPLNDKRGHEDVQSLLRQIRRNTR